MLTMKLKKKKKKKNIIPKGFFLHFMSYKSFEQKTVFQFNKKEASF
jgi:hypothetical protein